MKVERRYLQALGSEDSRFPNWHGLSVRRVFVELRTGGGYFVTFNVVREVFGQVGDGGYMHFFADGESLFQSYLDQDHIELIGVYHALRAGELRGDFECDAAHKIFWTCMVENVDGLRLLAHLHRESGEFYAIRAWEGRRCEKCHHPSMRLEYPDDDNLTRRCAKCQHPHSISREALLATLGNP